MSIELWTAPTPNGWKTSIMLEELIEQGVQLPDIQVNTVNLLQGEQFSDVYEKINPNQKIPALKHNNVCLMESCAILQYLAEAFPSSLMPEGDDRWDVLQWVYWQAANLGPVFGNKLSYTRYLINETSELQREHPLERFSKEAQRLLTVFNKQLEGKKFITGELFTIADIAVFPWVRAWKWCKIDITYHENVVRWFESVSLRPGVQRGVAYGAPKGEEQQWSKKTKKRYASSGAVIASNESTEN
ncbi:glutathione S-transferase family protein [Shewanella surugensis]|uniref:Glutathione S-transferase N-terminal domain-containing protein n=1 Tax=Shewanella surugensis TaxID=212020 RepID=A0ABT0LJQ7_9GAMM|nr:glutathione S-transferase N-terminal domain-containing protein [Shewanella surugensis]MCL1127356.1 glutathione S-transferase N-terminal domain-containing protein [Shewanella surugensis]